MYRKKCELTYILYKYIYIPTRVSWFLIGRYVFDKVVFHVPGPPPLSVAIAKGIEADTSGVDVSISTSSTEVETSTTEGTVSIA